MPHYICKHPTCGEYLKAPGYCEKHVKAGRKAALYYDQHLRNPASKQFYNSSQWQYARKVKLSAYPICERCYSAFAEHCHHIVPLDKCTVKERTLQSNLMSVCIGCHNAIEADVRKTGDQ